MSALRNVLTRLFRLLPALSLAILVAVILVHEAPRGAPEFEPLSVRPYAQPTQTESGFAALSHPPAPTAGA